MRRTRPRRTGQRRTSTTTAKATGMSRRRHRVGRRHGRGQPDDDAGQHALEARRPRRPAPRTHAIDWRFTVGDQVKIRLVNEMDSDHPMHHPFHIHGAGRFLVLSRDGVAEPNLVWKDTVLVRTGRDGGHPARRHQPRRLDGALPHRRAPRERNDVQLHRLRRRAARGGANVTLSLSLSLSLFLSLSRGR